MLLRPLLVASLLLLAQAASAQTVVPAPTDTAGEQVVDLPLTPSCTVTVAQNYEFDTSGWGPDTPNATYTPPANCPGPWSKVVLTMSGHVVNQYDRTGEIRIGNAEVLHFTTPEMGSWQIQRDITEYMPLLTSSQPVYFMIQNVLASGYYPIYGSVSLTFYQTGPSAPEGHHADAVLPVGSKQLSSSTDMVSNGIVFPQNMTRLEADLYTSGHGTSEEDWWDAPFESDGVPYREVAVWIDNQLAGVAPVYPTLYTGGWGPDWWHPIPSPRTFNLRPYRIDLTPFVGTLTDGLSHNVSVGIVGSVDSSGWMAWWTAANLLVYVNHSNDGRTKGGITSIDTPLNTTWVTVANDGSTTFVGTGTHHLKITGWTQSPNGDNTTTTVEEQIQATPNVASLVVLTDWDWTNTSTTTSTLDPVATVSTLSAHYEIDRNADFSFIDNYNQTVTHGGAPVSSMQVDDSMTSVAPAVGITGAVNTSKESWKYSDSNGVCVDHETAAAAYQMVLDQTTTTCPLTLP